MAIINFYECQLKQMASSTVICDGKSEAEIMLIGEATGSSEDQAGIPFCG